MTASWPPGDSTAFIIFIIVSSHTWTVLLLLFCFYVLIVRMSLPEWIKDQVGNMIVLAGDVLLLLLAIASSLMVLPSSCSWFDLLRL